MRDEAKHLSVTIDTEARPERRRRPPQPARRGYRTAWQEQAMNWRAPERSFICCGTTFTAMTADALLLMRNAHVPTHSR